MWGSSGTRQPEAFVRLLRGRPEFTSLLTISSARVACPVRTSARPTCGLAEYPIRLQGRPSALGAGSRMLSLDRQPTRGLWSWGSASLTVAADHVGVELGGCGGFYWPAFAGGNLMGRLLRFRAKPNPPLADN